MWSSLSFSNSPERLNPQYSLFPCFQVEPVGGYPGVEQRMALQSAQPWVRRPTKAVTGKEEKGCSAVKPFFLSFYFHFPNTPACADHPSFPTARSSRSQSVSPATWKLPCENRLIFSFLEGVGGDNSPFVVLCVYVSIHSGFFCKLMLFLPN